MAHFAEIDNNGVVLRVLVVDDLYENDGQTFLAETLGLGGTWVKTSYNTTAGTHSNNGTPLHKNFAGIGMIFDGTGFHHPQPYPSWTLNKDSYLWEAPVAYPNDGKFYEWNEDDQEWVEVPVSE